MKKSILLIILYSFTLCLNAQTKSVNSIGVSIPIIWNKSNGVYYQLGTRKEPEGNGTSFGFGLNYTKTIYKNLFGVVGIGYFNQTFGIKRPFNFISPDATRPLVQTESYSYDNLHLRLGIGYQMELNKTISLNGILAYNSYKTFKQKYNQTYIPNYSQIGHESTLLGNMISLEIGGEKNISKKISLGIGILVPISFHWQDDPIFIKYSYSNDSQKIALNNFSLGATISSKYNF